MSLKKFRPVVEITLFSAVAFLLHLLFFHFYAKERILDFRYSLPELYGFFFVSAIIIIITLVIVKGKSIDSVGNTFMLLTCLKMVLAYVLLHPILNAVHSEVAFEKMNFFIVFAIFLTLETIVTIRLLQKD